MKKLILISLFLFCSSAYAQEELYAVSTPDGVTIVHYLSGSTDTLEQVLIDMGLAGKPIKKVLPSDFPADRKDRKYWKMNDVPIGKKIVIDTDKKQADQDKETQKQADATEALLKICPTCDRNDFKKLLKGEGLKK